MKLKNGENPYQIASLEIDKSVDGLGRFKQILGDIPCYINIVDLDNITKTLFLASKSFYLIYNKVPFIAITAKHGNPCGMSIDWTESIVALENALWGNPKAVWGGEYICNFNIDIEIAENLYSSLKRKELLGLGNWNFDIIASPSISKEAKNVLAQRKSGKVFTLDMLKRIEVTEYDLVTKKSIWGGILEQKSKPYIINLNEIENSFPKKKIDSLIIAWSVAYSSFHGGNEVAFASQNQLLGVGGGPATVEAVEIAMWRAINNGFDLGNSVFCADAFFPFIDVPEKLVKVGCTEGLVPAGGQRFEEIKEFFMSNNCNVGFIPEEYRGFCRH